VLTHPLPGFPTPRNGHFGAARGWIGGIDYGTHNGHDWSAPSGTPIVAAGGGRVVHSAGSFCPVHIGAGNLIHIEHGGGIETRYSHMLNRLVANGQLVAAGQVIGGVGASGTATGAHLHFSVLVNGQFVDPIPHLGGSVSGPAVPLVDRPVAAGRPNPIEMPSGWDPCPPGYERHFLDTSERCWLIGEPTPEFGPSPASIAGVVLPPLLEPGLSVAIVIGSALLVWAGVKRALE
jgi:hypothetical protein